MFPQEAFNKRSGDGDGQGGADVKKRIHVRSKDPMRIARQMEKKMEGDSKKQRTSKGRPPPPQMKVNTICKVGIDGATHTHIKSRYLLRSMLLSSLLFKILLSDGSS